MITFNLPITKSQLSLLKVGDSVSLNGKIFVMRDAAHKLICQSIMRGDCTVDFNDAMIYYMGPCPAKDGEIIGSCGPTTSLRMDSYAPMLYDLGLSATIGKGERNCAVIQSIARNGAVYLAAIGGCGALYQSCITHSRIVAYSELGAEALLEITVKDFPAIVAIDSFGNSIY